MYAALPYVFRCQGTHFVPVTIPATPRLAMQPMEEIIVGMKSGRWYGSLTAQWLLNAVSLESYNCGIYHSGGAYGMTTTVDLDFGG